MKFTHFNHSEKHKKHTQMQHFCTINTHKAGFENKNKENEKRKNEKLNNENYKSEVNRALLRLC